MRVDACRAGSAAALNCTQRECHRFTPACGLLMGWAGEEADSQNLISGFVCSNTFNEKALLQAHFSFNFKIVLCGFTRFIKISNTAISVQDFQV
jgi:hypothetical protein